MDEAKIWISCWTLPQFVHVGCVLRAEPIYFANKSSLITIFLYMVAELSSLQQIVTALTGLNGLPAVIVECAVTTIYTCRNAQIRPLEYY
jgi:hypothetical protein